MMDITRVTLAIAGYGVHIFFASVQEFFIVYPLFAGISNLAYTGQNSKLLQNFGLLIYENNRQGRVLGYVKIRLGILLLLPSILGMPFLVSGEQPL